MKKKLHVLIFTSFLIVFSLPIVAQNKRPGYKKYTFMSDSIKSEVAQVDSQCPSGPNKKIINIEILNHDEFQVIIFNSVSKSIWVSKVFNLSDSIFDTEDIQKGMYIVNIFGEVARTNGLIK
ncbi:hypothetical protein K6119_01885 [Paracrocinitomix mangrovi]|uniref:hypothetical protein n=1 Tax=Paracrocinitomix mangrovi TaxID=2862509 RepID=UPI001C8EF180|nr:hypothetical protein [Paracrocinitomix mangrovi]UKN02268.1 hypothetical protein K6119_01885 [Paracrocinitomix mangrovi]